jgi:hypothetical protein
MSSSYNPIDELATSCPPCKIIICSGGVVGLASSIQSLGSALRAKNNKLTNEQREAMFEVIKTLWSAERSLNEAFNRLSEV